MGNIEKLIKSWEIFRDSNPYQICDGKEFRAIKEPEYCMGQMIEDTLALLKECEPRILGWDEIKDYPVVYGEFKDVKDIYPLIITVDDFGRCLSWNPGINTSGEYLLLVYDEEERKNVRCWNKMPTDKQRGMAKWDD